MSRWLIFEFTQLLNLLHPATTKHIGFLHHFHQSHAILDEYSVTNNATSTPYTTQQTLEYAKRISSPLEPIFVTMAGRNWTLTARMTLFILFNTYGFNPCNRDWWPIFTSINGTAREWLVVSEDWRFRGGRDRSTMWPRIEQPRSAYSQADRTIYDQTRANVVSTAATMGIALPPATQPAPVALPAAPVATSALPAALVTVASSSSTRPAAAIPAAATSSTLPVATSSSTIPAATAPTNTSSSNAPVAAGNSGRFDVFIGKLHAWEKLPIVHTRNLNTGGAVPTIDIRTPGGEPKLPNDLFVMDGSPFAPQVNRVTFNDQMTGESAEVDVVYCTSCVACGSQRAPVQPGAVIPIVHDSDVTMTAAQGATFLPGPQFRTRTAVPSADNYQMYVYFTGGKRVLVEVVA